MFGLFSIERGFSFIGSFVSAPDASAAHPLSAVSAAGFLRLGSFYSVVLASVYVPARLVLARATEYAWQVRTPDDETATIEEWKLARGLEATLRSDLSALSAILAPALSAPLATAIGSIF